MKMNDYTYAVCKECFQVNRVSIESAGEKRPVCGKCKIELPFHDGVTDVDTSVAVKALSEKSPVPVIVDFWAPWCGPCVAFAPIFNEAAKFLAGKAVLAKVNTQLNPLASEYFGIRGIPTLIAFEKGREKGRLSGALPLPEFMEWANRLA
jgi:thioredoxin 2